MSTSTTKDDVATNKENLTTAAKSNINRDEEDPAASEQPSTKKARLSTDSNATKGNAEDDDEVINFVQDHLGYQPGDKLEVQFTIEFDPDETTGQQKSETVWWPCTLEKWDGRSKEGLAIRVLEYEAWPEYGDPEKTRQDVIFLDPTTFMVVEDEAQYTFRAPPIAMTEEATREVINGMFMGLLEKHQDKWKKLAPAQQAAMASGFAKKKEQLLEKIFAHENGTEITADTVKEILQSIMQK